jgi:D-alanine-D-alanine ligase
MKSIFASIDLPQVNYLGTTRYEITYQLDETVQNIENSLGYPCFVKPANLGSSVGISKATTQEELRIALITAATYDRRVIVEEFVKCRELEIGVLGNENLQLSVVGEVTTSADFYDYEAKYQNKGNTQIQIPALVDESIIKTISEVAQKAYRVLDNSGLSRIDFFLSEDGRVLINEVNTMPGFTPFSMYPMLFSAAGTSYSELIAELISLGFERFKEKQKNGLSIQKLDTETANELPLK